MRRSLILGAGYVGARLAARLESEGQNVIATRRSTEGVLKFSLEDANTWEQLPSVERTFLMFPATPVVTLSQFLKKVGSRLGNVVCVGTTSSYLVSSADEVVKEDSPLNESDERVRGEREILESGGVVVRSAGIYGPGRSPLEWMRTGRVGATEKFVNFIHIDDLVEILWRASERFEPGRTWIAADGQPTRWREIFARLGMTPIKSVSVSGRESKRIDSSLTLKSLGVRLKFANIFDGVAGL